MFVLRTVDSTNVIDREMFQTPDLFKQYVIDFVIISEQHKEVAEEEGGFVVFDVMIEYNHLPKRHKENDIKESGLNVFSSSQSCLELPK